MPEMELLYPSGYRRVDGAVVSPLWAGDDIPVPPTWVRDFSRLPPGMEYATLALELADLYPPEVRETAVQYVKDWPDVRRRGLHLIIAGTGSTWRRRRWLASAVVNEIIMRYAQTSDVGQEWVHANAVRAAMTGRGEKSEYSGLRSKWFGAKLLFMEDPMRVMPSGNERWLIGDIYDARESRSLPTISTLTTNLDEGFGGVKATLGEHVSEILQHCGANYTVRY